MKRALFIFLGLAILAGAWMGPVASLAHHFFWAHMAMHMAVVAVASPLLALGIAGSLADPVRSWPFLFPPIPISLLELVAVWAWHTPALHHLARHSATGRMTEQAMFLLCGLLVWLAAFGGDSRHRQERAGAGVAALLLTSMHMTFLGALLALAPRPLYEHAGAASALPALQDQHLGGAIMLIAGGASYLAGGLWLTAGLARGIGRQRERTI